jgi:hypothetical protein
MLVAIYLVIVPLPATDAETVIEVVLRALEATPVGALGFVVTTVDAVDEPDILVELVAVIVNV